MGSMLVVVAAQYGLHPTGPWNRTTLMAASAGQGAFRLGCVGTDGEHADDGAGAGQPEMGVCLLPPRFGGKVPT
ncbi:hypothetical protein GGTG_10738 [Gaeumannomyces tritici R3-111a-1]|uniref:Uncharacterized protein n=1 Tax=Gaeumannomyces tritici (strain R3-111a-1) TaxID=644352 RepID=J3PB65_GAET3|nr:hypothetical protein GGTG_10738 [Gaeumannomyces tritici R3-111a-1]EJT71481.1 hypothetical protein GGTG_10738 [Gaeumannomyces tritici R3-111a-1]